MTDWFTEMPALPEESGNGHPTIAPVTLASTSRRVHEARRRLAVARGMLAPMKRKHPCDPAVQGLRELHDDAELMLLAEEDTLRALAVAAFHATGQGAVSPGIVVHERVQWDAKADPYLIPEVELADDLGAALDAAEADARIDWHHKTQSTEIWR